MGSRFQILVMAGDGIGAEITAAGAEVLRAVIAAMDIAADIKHVQVGKAEFAASGRYMPEDAELTCVTLAKTGMGAILFGAVESEPIGMLRQHCDLFANLRPLKIFESLLPCSRLRSEVVKEMDILIVRELVGGLYFGEERCGSDANGRWASQEMRYSDRQVRRIVRLALEHARARKKKLTYVHKENAIPTVFGLWSDVLAEEAKQFTDVMIEPLLVDNMAMQLVLRPTDFDVLLCENMFGDILSDLGAGVIGSIGVCPSASLNEYGFGLYESIGGCAFDIAGKDLANPISTILSVAMMCRLSLKNEAAARLVEAACERVLATHRTRDIAQTGCEIIGTTEMGERIAKFVHTKGQQ